MRLAARLPMLLAGYACVAAGCALPTGRSDPSTFFALTATESPDGCPPGAADVSLGLGPVTIPGYLDRPQLVQRIGANELRIAELARWAEPLREGIVRALQQDLVAACAARHVTLYPWTSSAQVRLTVAVDVLRFEPNPNGDAELVAGWSVRDLVHGRVLVVRESRLVEPVKGAGGGAEVAALSRTLDRLAREVAATLVALTS